ncbi:hypothetical protein DM01DRAFT_1339393 [Hesseltinella vesiculosa]|uniref:Uncharacterized protein n=1 Tax=Hesseltinella vesiculosa TaxID=101127 RepID=A0A1X2G704_9FUNG|nr:hypothetical protein DM01DRAFT_1339393 [Hesseltinella vesiculosa]
MAKRQRREIDYRGVDQDLYTTIVSLKQIPTQTSDWIEQHSLALNIQYKNGASIADITEIDDIVLGDTSDLILDGWNRNRLLIADEHDLKDGSKSNTAITIIRKLRKVLLNEVNTPMREEFVDSYVMTLLRYAGFDEEPFSTELKYTSTALIGSTKIVSKTDFMVTKIDRCLLLIVEDKHPRGVSEFTDWNEHQIAGEIFCSAFHNSNLDNQPIRYPLSLYAVRIIGTKFTFYKAVITHAYMGQCHSGLLPNDDVSLVITRYPAQAERESDMSRALTAWDFCIQEDRVMILKTLESLRELWL